MIWLMGEVSLSMQMEIYTKENGLMIRQMDSGNIYILMELSIMGLGKRIFRMGMALKIGLMEVNMKEII